MPHPETAPLRLSVAQFEPAPGDIEHNVERHLELIDRAASCGTDVLVFPELSLTGYELEDVGGLAMEIGSARVDPLRRAAVRASMVVVAGGPLRESGAHFLASFVLMPDGKEVVYTKHHLGAFSAVDGSGGPLPPAEFEVARPGLRNPLVSMGDHRLAFAICADISRPSHPQCAARRGATIYAASVFAIPSDVDRDVARLETYSRDYDLIVMMSNFCGETGGLAAGGASRIISGGRSVATLGTHETGVASWDTRALTGRF